jgi:Abortive infection alpha
MTSKRPLLPGSGAVDAATGIARGAARTWVQTMLWGTRTSLRAARGLKLAATDRDAAVELAHGAATGVRGRARDFLGVADLDERLGKLGLSGNERTDQRRRNGTVPDSVLRARGAELLRASADVAAEDGAHPAHARVLDELAPDEARILRLLAVDGAQPVVDVCAVTLLGGASEPIASNLNMIGREAGCRHRERDAMYLNNLERLGLIRFSDGPLEELSKYQVLEAQPEVLESIKLASRAKSVHRSVRLTPFGQDFCDTCLPLDRSEMEALLRDSARRP